MKRGFIERKIPAKRQNNIYVLPKAVTLIEDFDSFQSVEDEIVQALTAEEKRTLKEMLIKSTQTVAGHVILSK
ncbi:hypothetical protein J2TS6_09630 [Paenibacillus albilobatus]|uniref:Uncharacterized protein n=1 Tax=Paenibacillus albilobatus TaxID=2716884 RepID=A0A919XBY7_9BACL|nr:hypothetical protein [Paenibacillus albilobatus]GIO29822.1 hypothetical protein J2TS6_09630 [Paenibacillus albilobatus]